MSGEVGLNRTSHPQLKIGVGILCYIETLNEIGELEKCLESVSDFYPVVVIDGKWSDYDGKYTISIPEAEEIINSHSNTIHIKSVDCTESENRNKYLIGNLDYMIILDTDEYLEFPEGREFFERGLLDVFKDKKERCAYIHAESKGRGGYCRMQRIIRKPSSMSYTHKHNELMYNNINVLRNPLPAPRGLYLIEDRHLRSESRKELMRKRNRENPIH